MTTLTKSAARLTEESQSGIGIVEVLIALSIITVGLLGFISAISSAQVLTRGTKEVDLAHLEILNEVETFHESCIDDFNATLTTYQAGISRTITTLPIGKNVQIIGSVILDETKISPPIDLNGDDDYVDTAVTPAEARVGLLQLAIRWEGALGQQEIHYYSVVARGELR